MKNKKVTPKERMKKMAKIALLATIVTTLLLTTGCSKIAREAQAQEEQPRQKQTPNTLIFNTPEIESEISISWDPHDFYLWIDDDHITTLFPTLNITNHEQITTIAQYQIDGTLMETSTRVHLLNDSAWWLEILVGFENAPRSHDEYLFANDEEFEISDIFGIPVTALMVGLESALQRSFDATFVIDDIHYRIRFRDYEESGKNRLTDIITELILGGSDFTILENPEIPEIWSADLTLTEARNDAQFGQFVPNNIPEEITLRDSFRSVREYVSENFLWISWHMSYDEAHLYDIYNQWIANRTSTTPAYEFEEIFWLNNELSWQISKIREYDLDRIMTVAEFGQGENIESWEQPIFLAEEFTFDILKWHEQTSIITPQGADWDENADEANIFIPFETTWIQLNILFGDIHLHIHTGNGTISSEVLWEMLEELINEHLES